MREERTARPARRGFGGKGEGNEGITAQSLGRIWGTKSDWQLLNISHNINI